MSPEALAQGDCSRVVCLFPATEKRQYLCRVISTKPFLPVELKSYVAVENETLARELERYFKSGSGKAFANKRFWK